MSSTSLSPYLSLANLKNINYVIEIGVTHSSANNCKSLTLQNEARLSSLMHFDDNLISILNQKSKKKEIYHFDANVMR